MIRYPIDPTCPHCDTTSFALKHPLFTTENFYVVCDVHPIMEGHILIMPKWHIDCIGSVSSDLYSEFIDAYNKCKKFLLAAYGSVASFEHGIVGQTVHHAHVHLLPYAGKPEDIVPEGDSQMIRIESMSDVQKAFQKDGQYLFFSIGDEARVVDLKLGYPRFFRDRFASALGKPELGDWKNTSSDAAIQVKNLTQIQQLKSKWQNYYK